MSGGIVAPGAEFFFISLLDNKGGIYRFGSGTEVSFRLDGMGVLFGWDIRFLFDVV